MDKTKPLDLSALRKRQRILKRWSDLAISGLLFFVGLIGLSYFVFNASGVSHDVFRYKIAEEVLGFGELGGLGLAAVAYLKYLSCRAQYRRQAVDRLLADNGWSAAKPFSINKVAAILLGEGSEYGQSFPFEGEYKGQQFSCLIFQFDTAEGDTKRFVCLNFKLPKAYPMIVIDNKHNDHRYKYHGGELPDRIPNGTKLNLEGDFDRYYQVSITKGDEKKALQILSPDLMAEIQDRVMGNVDIEIDAKNLFLMTEADFYTEQNLQALFDMAGAMICKLNKLSTTWLTSSGMGEEERVAQSALSARNSLILRPVYASIAFMYLSFVVAIFLLLNGAHVGRNVNKAGIKAHSQGFNSPAASANKPSQAKPVTLNDFSSVISSSSASVVKIEANGCVGIMWGAGFVVAPGLVATNAHVIAGTNPIDVIDNNGDHTATPVVFDPELDFAVLRVSGLAGQPLPLNASVSGLAIVGSQNSNHDVMLGYPEGGDFASSLAIISDEYSANVEDLYGNPNNYEDMYKLDADVVLGDSGSPVIQQNGQVVGIVFAIDPEAANEGLAIPAHEFIGEVQQAKNTQSPVSTQTCSTRTN